MRVTARRLVPLALVVGLLIAPTASAIAAENGPDVVVLKDGRRIEGEVVAENDRFVSVRSDGVLRAYPKSQVDGVTKGERAPADSVADTPAEDVAKRKRKKKGDGLSKEDRLAVKGKRPGRGKLSPAAGEWLDSLIGRLARNAADGDPAVKASLAAAIRALGPPAAPRLRAAAKGSAGGTAKFLNQLAASIEDGARKRADKDRATSDKPMKGKQTDRAKRRVGQRVIDALGVADADADAVSAAFKKAYDAQRELGMAVRKGEMTRQEAGPTRMKIRGDLSRSMQSLLSAEQYVEYEKIASTLFRGKAYKGDKSDKKAKKQ